MTPSSKVVGDMTMFLVTRGIKPADVNLEPVPPSAMVIDMMKGALANLSAAGRASTAGGARQTKLVMAVRGRPQTA